MCWIFHQPAAITAAKRHCNALSRSGLRGQKWVADKRDEFRSHLNLLVLQHQASNSSRQSREMDTRNLNLYIDICHLSGLFCASVQCSYIMWCSDLFPEAKYYNLILHQFFYRTSYFKLEIYLFGTRMFQKSYVLPQLSSILSPAATCTMTLSSYTLGPAGH